MHPKPKHLFSVLIVLLAVLLGVFPGGVFAQEGALPLPEADTDVQTTEEAGSGIEQIETPQPSTEVVVINDDFESGLALWQVSTDLQVVIDESGNSAAELLPGSTLSPAADAALTQFGATVWFNLTSLPDQDGYGELNVLFGSDYVVKVTTEGVSLSKGRSPDQPLAVGAVVSPNDVWHKLDLQLGSEQIVVRLNDVEAFNHTIHEVTTRETLPTITPFTLAGGAAGRVLIDDVRLVDQQEVREIEEAPVVGFPTLDFGTVLSFESSKLSGELVQMLQAGAATSDNFGMRRDARSRISVEIWGAEGVSGEALVAVVEASGGKVTHVDLKRVSARLSLESIALLSLSEQVSVIHLTPQLSSTDPMPAIGNDVLSLNVADARTGRDPQGDSVTEGYDTTGVQAWHVAGYLGSGVRVAIIDVGFGDPSVPFNNNMVCLPTDAITLSAGTRAPGDSNRGLNMLEVLCDIAPGSEIRLYKAQTADQLFTAVQQASADQNRVIVIGVDLGVNLAPGDGTLGYSSAADPYAAIAAARAAGTVIVAAAGNSGQSALAFDLAAGGSATLTINARPGAAVNLGWNDWDANPNGGAPREDFSASLGGVAKPARGTSNPGYQFTVPTNCTPGANNLCTTTLTINGLSGDLTTIQVQVGGLDSSVQLTAGATAFLRAGSLARPADSPNVTAVGAVCASPQDNYPIQPYSSRGPVYQPGGDYTEIAEGPYTGNSVKPELVAPSQVSTSLTKVNNLRSCSEGFGGTQASAAHVGGQIAVLLSNPNIGSFQQPSLVVDSILRYLRSHTFDLPFGYDATANGYDMRRGAGVPVVGAPTFNPDALPDPNTFIVPNRIPAGECAGGLIYVGPYNIGAPNMDGTITRPFNHMAQAIKVASDTPGRCVIALPGEYTSPIYVNDPTEIANDVTVFSYASVVRVVAQPSTVYVVNSYTKEINLMDKRGAIYVDEEGFKFSGFDFVPGVIYASGTTGEPGVLVTDGAIGVLFSNNTINGFTTRGLPLIQIVDGSQNVIIRGNRFTNNVNAIDPTNPNNKGSMTLIGVEKAGAPAGRIFIEQNLFRANKSLSGSWILDELVDSGEGTIKTMSWMSLVRTLDSYTDITSNTFIENEANTLIQAVTRNTVTLFETRILGNAIVNNKMAPDPSSGLTSGPLIHLFNMQRIYVVNNTIARNNLLDSGANGMLVGRGDEVIGNFNGEANNNNSGSLASGETMWEFHNNFVIDNIVDIDFNSDGVFDEPTQAAFQIIGDLEASGVGCRNTAGQVDQGAKNNWLWRGATSRGVCNIAFTDGANGNIVNIDPFPRDLQYQPTEGVKYILGGTAADRLTPGYYSLTGASNDSEPDGVDEGLDSFVDTVLPEFATGRDARGVNRQNDGDADSIEEIDMGAYELTPLQLVNPIELTEAEDAGVLNVVLDNNYLVGGFPPYGVTITRYPKYYGISGVNGSTCDARFTAQARGVAVAFLTDGTPVLSYCPPPDFHTETTDPDFVPSQVGFDFLLTDLSSASASSSVTFRITPVNDAPLTTVLGDNAPAGDIIDAAVGIGRPAAQNTVRLRPFVDFSGNFFFSEWTNTVEPSAQNQVDYPFTYGTPTLLNDPSNQNAEYLANNLQIVNLGQGKIGFELSAAAPPPSGFAQAKFSYQVTDTHSPASGVTNIITVRAVQPPGNFNLISPASGTAFTHTADVRVFTWEEATNAPSYLFRLTRTSNNFPEVLLELNLTPAADADTLTCAAGTCTLTLTDAQQALVSTGQYEWTVIANNQGVTTTASNAPFIFAVNTGVNLLKNGSFEQEGANGKQALFWNGKGLDNDKRVCNKIGRPGRPDKIVAYEQNCAFQFKGKQGLNNRIQQRIGAFGKAGDTLELSYFAEASNLRGASVIAAITYSNGVKDKITVNPENGTYAYRSFSAPKTLAAPIASVKVRISVKNGRGRMRIDAVKLLYKTDEKFALVAPLANDVYASGADVTKLMWGLSVGAALYDVDVRLGATSAFSATNLTPVADSDGLTCDGLTCRFNLSPAQQSAVGNGTYTWQVTAKGGFTSPATNGPLTFTVDPSLNNLVANGSFEQNNSNSIPQGWNGKKLGGSRSLCDNPATGEYYAYQGNCAFQFKGAPNYNGKLVQNASTANVTIGNRLTLSVAVAGSGVVAGQGRVVATITYADKQKEKITIIIPAGNSVYTRLSDSRTMSKAVNKVKVVASYKGRGGSFLIDSVQLLRDETP